MAALTTPQMQTLKAAILADPVMSQHVSGPATDYGLISDWLNTAGSFVGWLTAVSPDILLHQPGFDWTRVDNLSVGKARIWEWMTSAGSIDPSTASVRAGIEACFTVDAGDAPCRQAIYNGSVKSGTRAETLLATGTGTAPTSHGVGPGLFTFQGTIALTDVGTILAS